jgi:DNA-binding MurR/RpiR family transcriptional regulator
MEHFFGESSGDHLPSSFEQQLTGRYGALSAKLREAADYVVANPVTVATRSLRAVSKDANLSPATFSRMSTAVGYDSYDALRDVLRRTIEHRANSYSLRVEALQAQRGKGDESFLFQHIARCAANLEELGKDLDPVLLERCVERLHTARQVHVLGALGSTGVAEYLTYMASMIADNWSLTGRMGASVASGLVGLTVKDVLVIITKPPFAAPSIAAARAAAESGAFVLVITDTHTCPALTFASASFIVPTGSPHFFSSYASTLVLSEVLVGMLAARAGQPARDRIEEVENQNRRLREVWAGE